MRTIALAAAATLLGLGFTGLRADEAKPTTTTVTVKDMTCAGCAKKITKALTTVSGVEGAKADVEKQTLTITPKKDKAPSPKDLWEAVVKAGYTPTQLEGPDGKFEKKPVK